MTVPSIYPHLQEAKITLKVEKMVVYNYLGIGAFVDRSSYIYVNNIKLVVGACREPINCNFNDGMCGWTQDESSPDISRKSIWKWPSFIIHRNAIPDCGFRFSGGYAFAESNFAQPSTRLISGEYEPTSVGEYGESPCLSFCYFIFGDSAIKMQIHIMSNGQNDSSHELVWSKGPSGRNVWSRASVPLELNQKARLAVSTVSGKWGVTAIDDVFLEMKANCSEDDHNPPSLSALNRLQTYFEDYELTHVIDSK